MESGYISKKRRLVYDFIYSHPGSSQKDAEKALLGGATPGVVNSGAITARFAELEKLGYIEVSGKKINKDSGRNVLAFISTNKFAEKAAPKKKKRYMWISPKLLERPPLDISFYKQDGWVEFKEV